MNRNTKFRFLLLSLLFLVGFIYNPTKASAYTTDYDKVKDYKVSDHFEYDITDTNYAGTVKLYYYYSSDRGVLDKYSSADCSNGFNGNGTGENYVIIESKDNGTISANKLRNIELVVNNYNGKFYLANYVVLSDDTTTVKFPRNSDYLFSEVEPAKVDDYIKVTTTLSLDWKRVDTSEMKSANHLFDGFKSLSSNIKYLDLSSLKSARYMFYGITFDGDIWAKDEDETIKRFMSDANRPYNKESDDKGAWDLGNLQDASYMFANSKCKNVQIRFETEVNCSHMFYNATTSYLCIIENYYHIYEDEDNNVGFITDASYMFANYNTHNFDISYMNSSKIENATHMFSEASGTEIFRRIDPDGNLYYQDLSSLKDASFMYYRTDLGIYSIYFDNTSTPNLENMQSMFEGATSKVPMHGEDRYLLDIITDSITTDKVTNMRNLFKDCKLSVKDFTHWNTSNVVDMSGMFYNAGSSSESILNIGNWDTSKVKYMNDMFRGSYFGMDENTLKSISMDSCINASHMYDGACGIHNAFNYIDNFNSNKVTDFSYFIANTKFNDLDLSKMNFDSAKDLSYFAYHSSVNTIKVPSNKATTPSNADARYMFSECKYLKSVDMSFIDLNKVIYLEHMFDNCKSITIIDGLDVEISNIQSVQYMFNNCELLNTELNLDNWVFKYNVKSMSHMFNNCASLKTLNANWDMSYAVDISYIFNNCKSLKDYSDDIVNKLSSSLEIATYAWYNCDSLTQGYLSGLSALKIYNATDLSYMLSDIDSLESLDFSGLYTTYTCNFEGMFSNCDKLKDIKLGSSSNIWRANNIDSMFENDIAFKILDLSYLDLTSIIDNRKTIDGCDGLYEFIMPINCTSTRVVFTKPLEKNNFVWCDYTDKKKVASTEFNYDYMGHTLKLGFSYRIDKNSDNAEQLNTGVFEKFYFYNDSSFESMTNRYKVAGYDFVGFNYDKDAEVGDITEGQTVNTQDAVIKEGTCIMYCIWKPIEYTIHYNANGAIGTMADKVVKYGSKDTLDKCIFTYGNKIFKGWSFTKNGYVKFRDEREIYNLRDNSGIVNLYAIWGEKQPIISFYDRDKHLVTKSYVDYGVSVDDYKYLVVKDDKVSINKFAIYDSSDDNIYEFGSNGYTFNGWKLLSDDTDWDTSLPITNDISVYSKSTANTYKVILNSDGNTSTRTYTYGVGLTLPTVTKNGYVFDGWYTDLDDANTRKDKISNTDYGTITLYAKLLEEKYNISYELGGGLLDYENPSNYTVKTSSFVLNNPEKRGYEFIGWTDDTVVGDTPKTRVAVRRGQYGNKSFTANYKVIDYTITYDYNGGKLDSEKSNPATYTVNSSDITVNNPVKDGYTFIGWTGTGHTSPTLDLVISKNSIGNRKYKANWEVNDYNIDYDYNNGKLPSGKTNPKKYQITSDEITLENPERKGYTFVGWTGTGLTVPTVTVKIPTGEFGDRNYKANWKVIDYSITYDLDGGNLEQGKTNPSGYTIESSIVLNNPIKKGYDFKGWIENSSDTPNANYTISKGTIGEKSLKAIWSIKKFKINCNINGGTLPSGVKNPVEYTIEGSDYLLSTPSKKGYDFIGWTDDSVNNDVPKKTVIVKVTDCADKNYTANWKAIEYSISYNYNNGSLENGKTNPTKYTIEDEFTLNNPSKIGYGFKGWLLNGNVEPQTEMRIEKGTIGDLVFNTVYQANTYYITCKLNGGTLPDGVENPVSYTVADSNYTLSTPSKKGYDFIGWTDDSIDGDTPKMYIIVDTSKGKDKNYTANWKAIEYNITYDYNNGKLEDGVTNPTKYTVEDEVKLNNPSKKGYEFDGWNDGNKTYSNYIIPVGSIGDIDLKAVFTVKDYDITYDYKGGKLPDGETNPTKYTVNDNNITINNPEKKGYDFTGWTDNNSDVPNKNYVINKGSIGKLDLIANWTVKDYDIKINTNGGKFDSDVTVPTKYTVEDEDIIIPNPKKKGYDFINWTDENNKQIVGLITKGSTGDKTFNADYNIKDYQITYDYNGGKLPDGETNPSKYTVEDEFTLNNPEKKGYKFSGWVYDNNIEPQKEMKVSKGTIGDITFKAVWKVINYNIILDENGGTFNEGETIPKDYTIEDELDLPKPNKKGYDFKNWLDDNKNEHITKIEKGTTGDLSATAQYEIKHYGITYDYNGGKLPNGKTNPTDYTVDDEFTLNNPEKKGYDFTGWTKDNEDKSQKEVIIKKGTIGDTKYKANWDLIDYEIKLDTNGGGFSDDSKVPKHYNIEEEIVIPNPIKRGYNFTGWVDKDGNDVSSVIPKGNIGDIDLIAKYDVIKYNISYELDGGTLGDKINPTEYTVEDEFTLNNPSKEGYTFNGWIMEVINRKKAQKNGELEMIVHKGTIGDLKFVALWTEDTPEVTPTPTVEPTETPLVTIEPTETPLVTIEPTETPLVTIEPTETPTVLPSERPNFNIKYNLNGGKCSKELPNKYFVDEDTKISNPVKKGYVFIGWSVDNKKPIKDYVIKKGTTGNLNFVAKYDVINYKIIYKLQGGKLSKVGLEHNPKTYTINDRFTLINPTRKDYDFVGWKYSKTGKISKKTTVKKGTIGNITFTAQWEKAKVPDTYVHMNKIINKGSIFKIKLLNTKGCKVNWDISKKGIVKIKGNTLKAVKLGSTDLVCTVKKKGYIIYRFGVTIKVEKTGLDTLNTSDMTTYGTSGPVVLLDKSIFIESNNKFKIKYKKLGNAKITYKVKDKKIVTIDKNGVVTGHKQGFTYGVATVKKDGKVTHYVFHFKVEKELK